jgi:hypothetical protein
VRSAPRGVTLPKDVARWEASRADNERQQVRRQRKWLWSTTRAVAKACTGGGGGGLEETFSKPESSGDDDEVDDEDKEEGEITPSPHSPPPKDVPSIGDLCSQ